METFPCANYAPTQPLIGVSIPITGSELPIYKAFMGSRSEGVADHDRVVALGTCGKQRNRRFDELFDSTNVFDRGSR